MSIQSRKRRTKKRGGMIGHLGRIADLLRPYVIAPAATEAQRFADFVVRRGAHVYAHPDVAPKLREFLGDIVHESAMIEHGRVMAMVPDGGLLGRIFRPDIPIPSAIEPLDAQTYQAAIKAGRRCGNR